MDSSQRSAFVGGGGRMGAKLRAFDWSRTSLGPVEEWTDVMRSTVDTALLSGFPVCLFFGQEYICIYNDAYAPILGEKPEALGCRFADIWAEAWDQLRPIADTALAGEPTFIEDYPVEIERSGRMETAYFTFSYSPVFEGAGNVIGIVDTVVETTRTVLAHKELSVARARQEAMLQQMPGFAALLSGPDHIFTYVNEAYRQISGPRDFIGNPARNVFPDVEGQGLFELLDHVFATGERYSARSLPIQLQGEDTPRHVDLLFEAIRDEAGNVQGIFVGGYDVTEQHSAEAALRQSEEQLRQATEAAEIGLWDLDLVNGARYWTPRVKAMFGMPADAPVGLRDFYAYLHPDDVEATQVAFNAALDPAVRAHYDVEYRTIGKTDGLVRWVAAKGRATFDDDNKPVRVVGTAIDITDKKNSERRREALFELTDAIRTADDTKDIAYAAAKILGRVLDASRAGFGWVNAAGTGLIIEKDWVANGVRSLAGELLFTGYEAFLNDLRSGAILQLPDVFEDERTRGVADRWSEAHVRALVNVPVIEHGELVALLYVNHAEVRSWSQEEVDFVEEVTQRVRTATARLHSDEELRALNVALETRVQDALKEKALLADIVDTTDAMIQVLDLDYNWMGVNRASADEFEKVVGLRPTVGANMLDALTRRPELLEGGREVWARAFAGEKFTTIVEFPHTEYTSRFYEMNFSPLFDADGGTIGAYQFVYDVTDRVQDQKRLADAETHLRQSQKMEAVGQLTGGIAHDFNNMLAVVMGSLELLQRRVGDDSRARHFVTSALEGAKRAATLTQRLLAFSRQQPLQPEPINANRLVAGMSELLSHSLGGAVRLDTVGGKDLWTVYADPNQLENVILNLAVNARDAMPDGGKVIIGTENMHLDAKFDRDAKPGDYVLISVTDTGSGMPPEVIARAFDPFFTTKGVGKGTGLGLSQVYGFVTQSGGYIKIESAPGAGTTIKIYLPRHDGPLVIDAAVSEGSPTPRGEKELILIVDDEPAMRQFSVDAIAELGYRTVEASDAAEALQRIMDYPEIALLFTDVVMPDVNGRKLAAQAQQKRPKLKVLYTTGYTKDAVVHNGILDPGVEMIGKPFSLDELAARLHAMLDTRSL